MFFCFISSYDLDLDIDLFLFLLTLDSPHYARSAFPLRTFYCIHEVYTAHFVISHAGFLFLLRNHRLFISVHIRFEAHGF